MQITFVINNHHSHVTTGFPLNPHRFTINDVLEANLTGNLRENRNGIRVPLAEHGSLFDFLALFDSQSSTSRHGIGLDFTTTIVDDGDFTISSQHNLLTRRVLNRTHSGQTNFTSLL